MYVCMCRTVCMYVMCMYVCMYACMYVCTDGGCVWCVCIWDYEELKLIMVKLFDKLLAQCVAYDRAAI